MKRRKIILLLAFLIIGCEKDSPVVPTNEIKDVAWIYYGNHNQPNDIMTGCYWTDESFPNLILGQDNLGMYQFKDSNENIHSIGCESFGRKDYIYHNLDDNYFSIYLESHLNPQHYDTLMYEYINNQSALTMIYPEKQL